MLFLIVIDEGVVVETCIVEVFCFVLEFCVEAFVVEVFMLVRDCIVFEFCVETDFVGFYTVDGACFVSELIVDSFAGQLRTKEESTTSSFNTCEKIVQSFV